MKNSRYMIREKAAKCGFESMSDKELLELVSGTDIIRGDYEDAKNVIDDAAKKTVKELMMLYGLSLAKAVSIKASEELGRRIFCMENGNKVRLNSPESLAKYLIPRLGIKPVEEFVVLCFDTKNRLIGSQVIARGSLSSAVVHPREVFNYAIVCRAASIIVAHNHPSGETRPSDEDKELTKALIRSGDVIGIPVNDHLIVGSNEYYSFRTNHCMF